MMMLEDCGVCGKRHGPGEQHGDNRKKVPLEDALGNLLAMSALKIKELQDQITELEHERDLLKAALENEKRRR